MDPIQEYYNDLIKRGKFNANEYSLDEFRSWVNQDPSSIQQLYNDDIKDGLYSEKEYSLDAFKNYLGANIRTPLHDYFAALESDNNYQAYNPDGGGQGAVGAYQVRYNSHQKDIAKVTGINNRDEFYSDSYAQDKYMSHLIDQYQQHLPELQKINEERGLGLSDWELMYTEHHEGYDGAKKYLLTGTSKFGSEETLDTMYHKGRKYLESGGQTLATNKGSASAPVSSLISFDTDVDQSKFTDDLVKNLYKQNGGKGEVAQAGIQKYNGLFGKYDNTYAISVRDTLGEDHLIKYEDVDSSSDLESAQNNLIELGGAFANGIAKAGFGTVGLLKDLQELITSGDTSLDKVFDYQDNPLTKKLTEAYNTNIDPSQYSDQYKKLLEDQKIAEEGGDALGALGKSLSKVFHSEFWKDNGLETVGNSLSFFVPGVVVGKAAGVVVKGAKVLGLGEKGTKMLAQLGVGATLNGALEAGAEGAETFKAAYEHGIKKGMTEEEARVMASDYAAEVAATNMPILMASNALELLGIGGKLLSTPGLKRFIYNAAATAVPEGIQEGLQFGIQDNAKRYETENYDPNKVGLVDNFSGAMGGALNSAYKGLVNASSEFYDSVVMGGLMGGAFGAPGAAKSTYDYYKVEKPLAKDVNSVLANSFSDIYERDADGNFIDDNGKIKINGSKLQSHLNGLQNERYLAELESLAAKQDNGEAVKMIHGSKISKIIHDSLASGKDVDNIKNAIDQAFTKDAYKDNKLKEHYSFEEYKDFRNNAVKFSEDAYNETYANPLLAKQSAGFKENVYYNLSQQKMINNELAKYNSRLEAIPEKPSPLQKLEKEDLTTKIEAVTKFKENLESAYIDIFKGVKEDKKASQKETKVEEQKIYDDNKENLAAAQGTGAEVVDTGKGETKPKEKPSVAGEAIYRTPAILPKNLVPDGENTLMNEDELALLDARVEKILAGEQMQDVPDVNRVIGNGKAFLANEIEDIKTFLNERREGRETRSFSEWRKNTRVTKPTEIEVNQGLQEGKSPEEIIIDSDNPQGAADLLQEEAKKNTLNSLDTLNSKKEYQEKVRTHPHLSKEISDHYNSRIEKQKSNQKEIKSAQDLVGRYGEENNLLKEHETEGLFSNFKSRLESEEGLQEEIKNYETLRDNPNHTFKPNPKFKFLGQHILAGGNLDSYSSLSALEHNIADPLLQDSIDNKPISKTKEDKRKNAKILKDKLVALHKEGKVTKEEAANYIEDAFKNNKITKAAKDKLIEDVNTLFVKKDPRIQQLIDLGYSEDQALSAIENGIADEIILKKGKSEVLFEQGPSVITPLFIDTSVGAQASNHNLVQVESVTPDGKKSLHTISKTILFGTDAIDGMWSSSKQDILCDHFKVPPGSTFRIVSQPSAFYENNLVETNKILSTAEPGDQFYYETDYTRSKTKDDFEINIVFYSKNGKIVTKETEGSKKHTAGVVRASTNPALNIDEATEIAKLREKLFTGISTITPIKLKSVIRKASLNIGNLRGLTKEESNNEFDVVIANWEDPSIPPRFSSNQSVGDTYSPAGKGAIKSFVPRMLGKVFMFLKSWDKSGNEKNIAVELETKKVSEVPRFRQNILDILKNVEAQKDEKSAKKTSKEAWKDVTKIVKLRTPDSKFDSVNTYKGIKAGMVNPRGGIGPVFTYFFESSPGKPKGFLTKKDGKTYKGLSAEELVELIEDHRINVPHNDAKKFIFANPDVLLTDLDVNSTQDNQLVFDNDIESLSNTQIDSGTRVNSRAKPVRFKVEETSEKEQKTKDLSYIKDRFANLGIVVSNKELNKLAEIFGANTGTVWGAFHDAVLFLHENAGIKFQKHEAFHVLFNVYLTPEQQKVILKEAYDKFSKELGITKEELEQWLNKPIEENTKFKVEDEFYKKQNPLIRLEEKLAEMFEDFSVENIGIASSEFKKSYPEIAKFFDELYKFIYDVYRRLKPYFTDKLSIQDIFYQLEKNTFNKKIFNERLTSYQKLSQYTPKFKIDTLNPIEVKRYSRFIATDTLEQALWKYEATVVNGEIKSKYGFLNDLTKTKRNEFLQDFIDKLDKLVENHFKEFGNPEVGAKIVETLKSNKVEFLKYILQDINTLYDTHYYMEEAEEDGEKVNIIRETNVNPTQNIKGKLKEYLHRIPIRKKVNGQYQEVINEDFGIEKRHDFEQVYNKLLQGLSDNPTPEMFWDKLQELATKFDWADHVNEHIKATFIDDPIESELFRVLYAKTGGMRNINFISETRKKGSSKFFEAGKRNVANELIGLLSEKFDSGEANVAELKKIIDTVKDGKLTEKDIYPLLTNFGFDITEDEASYLFSENAHDIQTFFNFLVKNIDDKDFHPFRSRKNELNKMSRRIANLVAKLPSKHTMTVLTVKNENEYIHQANNFVSKFFAKLKVNSQELYNRAQGSLIHEGIMLYTYLTGQQFRDKFNIQYDLGFKEAGRGDGVEYKEYLFSDLLTHDFNAYLTQVAEDKRIRVPLPTFSDATSRAYLVAPMESDVERLTVPLVKAEMERIKYCRENKTGYRNFDINGTHFVIFPFLEKHSETLFNTNPDLLDDYIEGLLKDHISDRIELYTDTLVKEGVLEYVEDKDKHLVLTPTDSVAKDLLSGSNFPTINYAIREYYKNRWFYNTQLIPMLAGDPAFYGNYKSSKSKYDYKKIPDSLLKRMKELHSPKEDAIIVDDNNNIKTIRQLVVADVLKDSSEEEIAEFKQIFPGLKWEGHNLTDGQSITTLDFNRQVRSAYGELNKEDLAEYEKIKAGKHGKTTPGFTKPYYYNLETRDNLLYPLQEKSSEFPLIPAEAFLTKNGKVEFPGSPTDFNKYTRPILAKMLWLMNGAGDPNRAFDKIVFESVIKTDINEKKLLSIDDINNLDFKKVYSSIEEHSAADYGRQQVVPTDKHYNNKQKYGSQARVAITADLNEDVTVNGKTYTPAEIRELHDSILVANIEDSKDTLKTKFANLDSFVKVLREGAVNRNKSVDQLMAYEIQEDGYPAVPIDYPLTSVENQKLANAETKKAIITPVPGGTFVNRSSIGYADDLEVKRIYKNGVAVGIEYVEVAIPAHNSALLLLADKNGVIDFKKLKEEYPNFDKLLEGFGYRIPTEDKYSMYPIRIKYLLPQNTDATIVLPKEATTITGLDFDVDKMFVMFRAFKIKKGNFSTFTDTVNIYAKTHNLLKENGEPVIYSEEEARDLFNNMLMNEQSKTETERILIDYIKQDFNELKNFIKIEELGYIEPSMDNTLSRHNLMMDIILSITKTESYAESFLEGGNSDVLKENIERLKDYPLDKNIPEDVIDPLHQDYNSKKAIVGGNIIGIAASHNKHHFAIQGQKFGAMNPFNFLDGEHYQSLTKQTGEAGRISKFISSILFASTEHIKNPLLDQLGITAQNVSIFITGLRLGIPFSELCTLYRNPAVINLFNGLSKIKFPSTRDFDNYIQDTYELDNKSMGWFNSLETQHLSSKALLDSLSNSNRDLDLVILSKLRTLFDISTDLGSVMRAGKFDTEDSFGPSLYDNLKSVGDIEYIYKKIKASKISLSGIENILPNIDIVDDKYVMTPSNLKLNDTYISLIVQQLNGLKPIFGFLSKNYKIITDKVLEITGLERFDVKKLQTVHNAVRTAIAQHVLKFSHENVVQVNNEFKKVKKDKVFNAKYPNLIKLIDIRSIRGQAVIQKITPYKIDKGTTSLIKSEWATAMADPAYSIFARNLATYSLITSDFSFRLNSFSQFIPEYEYLTGTVEGKKVRTYFNKIADVTSFTKEEDGDLALLIIQNKPELTRYIDVDKDADTVESFRISTGETSSVHVKNIIKLKGNARGYTKANSDTPLEYIHTTVFYLNKKVPILYKYNGNDVYEMVILPSNPLLYSVYTKETEVFYPLLKVNKVEDRDFTKDKEYEMGPSKEMVDDGYFADELGATDINDIINQQESSEDELELVNGFYVKKESPLEIPKSTNLINYYEGDIKPELNTVFVFGSNPKGVNGRLASNEEYDSGGAAAVAQRYFGVKANEIMDNTLSENGKAYGLVTVIAPGKKLSKTPEQITENIKKLYEVAKQNPDKQFKIAYRNTIKKSLNGYTGLEMIDMFNAAGNRPTNIYFSKEWVDTGLLNKQSSSVNLENGVIYEVDHYKIRLTPDGKMYFKNGEEVTDTTIQNKVLVQKESKEKTAKTSHYNKTDYVILSDGRIISTANFQEKTFTEQVRTFIIKNAKKMC